MDGQDPPPLQAAQVVKTLLLRYNISTGMMILILQNIEVRSTEIPDNLQSGAGRTAAIPGTGRESVMPRIAYDLRRIYQ